MAHKYAIGGLALFAMADVVLLTLIVMNGQENKAQSRHDQTRIATTVPVTPETAQPPSEAFTIKPEESVLLAIGRDDTVIRAVRGSCEGSAGAKLAISSNMGESFKDVPSPVSEILNIAVDDARSISVVGAAADCIAVGFSSTDGGATWTRTYNGTAWHLGVNGTTQVVSPAESSKPGCKVVNLDALDDSRARVTCTNGDFYGTGNGGKEWTKLGHLDDVRQAGFPAASNGYALARYQGCAAQAFTTRDGARTWSPGGCITGATAEALAFNDTIVIAQVSGDIYVSNDRGETWSQP